MTVEMKKLHSDAVVPKRATPGSAGMDLYAVLDEAVEIKPGEIVKINTGIAMSLGDSNAVGLVFARSGLAVRHGIALANSVGVIDSDYTGEIIVGLVNLSDKSYTIQPKERIAQLVIAPVLLPVIKQVENLKQTERGDGGFGSTGKK